MPHMAVTKIEIIPISWVICRCRVSRERNAVPLRSCNAIRRAVES